MLHSVIPFLSFPFCGYIFNVNCSVNPLYSISNAKKNKLSNPNKYERLYTHNKVGFLLLCNNLHFLLHTLQALSLYTIQQKQAIFCEEDYTRDYNIDNIARPVGRNTWDYSTHFLSPSTTDPVEFWFLFYLYLNKNCQAILVIKYS